MTQGTPLSDDGAQRRETRSAIFRQVSQDALAETTTGGTRTPTAIKCCIRQDGRGSPARCVSDFDRVTGAPHSVESENGEAVPENVPAFRTPLQLPAVWEHHVSAVRLEADLHPFRLIVARLIANNTLNRKGIFSTPVDPVALKLNDYFAVVKQPMDLGTVRTKLHSMQYSSRKQVVQDIRLVFSNAMTYNPPDNSVHIAAKQLLEYFEEQLEAFVPDWEEASSSSSHDESSGTLASAALQHNPTHGAGKSLPLTLTRQSSSILGLQPVEAKKRKKRGTKQVKHACHSCNGRKCDICLQGCLQLEPTLLICSGQQCCGARIRKGGVYYVAPDGSRQYCDRCHIALPALMPATAADSTFRYKRTLLKRKNDEEIVEDWISCKLCDASVHRICAMFNEYTDKEEDFVCGRCTATNAKPSPMRKKGVTFAGEEAYTYVSGAEDPIPMTQLAAGHAARELWTADSLPESCVSSFIQEKVRDVLRSGDFPNADRTVTVRVISDSDRYFRVPDVVRNHFRLAAGQDIDEESQRPPSRVHYRSKAIALFQKIDAVDVCIFCMYVHEYDGNDSFDQENRAKPCAESKRVYIAYLDSVEHFRPRPLRTSVYHEILVSYLATARLRGYESAHIWACPPCRGNSFVFWSYPSSQRTPSQERLRAWYHESLLRALDKGVLTDVKSLYESDFEPFAMEDAEEGIKCENVCPPLFDGDYWIEEAIRLHASHLNRHLRSRTADGVILPLAADKTDASDARCPAVEAATLLRDKIISDPVALFFRKPVNAAALNLADYHSIIDQPMDLGTIYAKCMVGEYATLQDLVDDVELVVANAKKFNPPGHIVHTKADELRVLFFKRLNEAVQSWPLDDVKAEDWRAARDLNLRLDARFSSDSASEVSFVSGSSQTLVPEKENTISVPQILAGGAVAVEQRMAGKDTWLLEKKSYSVSGKSLSKKAQNRRRKSNTPCPNEPPAKRRRQSWLAEDVCASVRKMRMALFSCSLVPQETSTPESEEKEAEFIEYARNFNAELDDTVALDSTLADARHALLEFSQFRNLQFDTLRRAKYSTTVLLYHLHNPEAPGVVPCCSGCGKRTGDVRWHKVGKVVEKKRPGTLAAPAYLQKRSEPSPFVPEEICSTCFAARPDQSDFIPVQVTCS